MNNKITISIVLVLILGIGSYLYATKKGFKQFINKNIIGEKKTEILKKEYWIYNIADGTYSRNTEYAIPQIDTNFISRLIDSIHVKGSGKYWLSYIDKDSKNNKCLYFSIPSLSANETYPAEKNGESSFDYQDRVKKWKENALKFSQDSIMVEAKYMQNKSEFLRKCDSLLSKTVYIKSNENKFSDVVGTLNSSFRTLNGNSNTKIKKYIVAFSDLEQDTPYLNPIPELESIPEGVTLIATNPVAGSSNTVTNELEELDSPERVIDVIFN